MDIHLNTSLQKGIDADQGISFLQFVYMRDTISNEGKRDIGEC